MRGAGTCLAMWALDRAETVKRVGRLNKGEERQPLASDQDVYLEHHCLFEREWLGVSRCELHGGRGVSCEL